jgi:cysteine desulfurase
MIYNFDANATLGILPEISNELGKYYDKCFNPSSIHRGGQKSRALVEEAREVIQELMNASDYRVVFNSGATESNNTALWQAYYGNRQVFTSKIEHPCILDSLKFLSQFDIKTNFLELNEIRNNSFSILPGFYSLMWANNETGQIFDVKEIARRVKKESPESVFHTDAVQMVGKEEVDLNNSDIDLVSISGHKIGALSGIGALLVKKDFPFNSLIKGGTQQLHYRAGTENVLGIVSFALAARYWIKNSSLINSKLKKHRDFIINFIKTNLLQCCLVSNNNSLCNTISLRVPNIKADDLVVALDMNNFCISSGAACSSGKPNPSHVLLAMGYSEKESTETIRVSLSPSLTLQDVKNFCKSLQTCLQNFTV